MYPMHRLAFTNEINGETEFKYKNLKKYFPLCNHVWVIEMRKIKAINSNELCDYLMREIIFVFGSSNEINFTI